MTKGRDDKTSVDPAQLLADWMQGAQAMLQQQFAARSPQPGAGPDVAAISTSMLEMQRHALEQFTAFWTGVAGGGADSSAAATDRRFAADAWRDAPGFDFLRRTYSSYATFLQGSVDRAPVDEKTRGQLQFAVRQFVDAMSPSNFLATNPEAAQLAIETGGQSLAEGMQLFFQDLAKGRVSMTDERVFEVGRNIATTPGAVIFENEVMQLIQYTPTTKDVFERPLVIIPPCVNKFYILDLQPDNSFVRHALDLGHEVFMVSWRNVTAEQGHLTWDDYLADGVIKAIDVAREARGAEKVNALGFCVGGTLLGCALAVMAGNDEDKVQSATFLTTMLDFSETGELGLLVSEKAVAAREAAIGKGGILSGKELGFVFSSLRANDLIWQYVVNSYLKGKAPPAFDLLYWNSDGTNLPGPMVTWFVRNAYLENKFAQPGKTVQCGVPVDLGTIEIPAYVYASREDHIVPWQTAYRSGRLFSGLTTFALGASGHIAGVINPPAKGKRNYWVDGLDSDDPEQWVNSARNVPGSWWPHWAAWLARHAGKRAPIRKPTARTRKYKPIEPAPGRYVLAKAE